MVQARKAPVHRGQLSVIRSLGVYGEAGQASANLVSVWPVPADAALPYVWDAWMQLVRAHESLRTSYDVQVARPVQTVWEFEASAISTVEVSDARVSTARLAGLAEAAEPIDLTDRRPWRAFVAMCEGAPVHLVVVVHHIAADNAALGILPRQFLALLEGEELPPQVQPVEVAAVHDADPDGGGAVAHWAAQWGTLLPEDRFRADHSPRRRASVYSIDAMTAARTLVSEWNVSVQSLVLAAGLLVLTRHTGRSEITMGLMTANRLDDRWAPMVSSLNQCAPLTPAVDPGMRTGDFVHAVYRDCLNAYLNGSFDVDRLTAALAGAGIQETDPTFFGLHYNFLGEGDGEPESGSPLWTNVAWRPSSQRVGPYLHLVAAVDKGLVLGVGASEAYLPGNLPAVLVTGMEGALISMARDRPEHVADVSLTPVREFHGEPPRAR